MAGWCCGRTAFGAMVVFTLKRGANKSEEEEEEASRRE
jgi:hypothetical protein